MEGSPKGHGRYPRPHKNNDNRWVLHQNQQSGGIFSTTKRRFLFHPLCSLGRILHNQSDTLILTSIVHGADQPLQLVNVHHGGDG